MEDVRARKGAAARTRSLVFVGLAIAIMAVSAWVAVPLGPVPFTLQMFALVFAIVVLTPRECIAAVTGYLLLGAVGLPVFSGMRGGIGVLAGPTGGFLWGYLLGAAAGALLLWVVRKRMAAKAAEKAAGKASGAPSGPTAAAATATAAAPASSSGAATAAARVVPEGDVAGGASVSAGVKTLAFLRDAGFDLLAGFLFTAVSYLCGWAQFMAVAGVGPEAAFVAAIAPFIVVDVFKVVVAVLCARAVRAVVR